MHACVAPVVDFCILQGHDLASSGASLVTGRVAVPESLGTAGLLAWGLFSGLGKDLERQPWAADKHSSSGGSADLARRLPLAFQC